MGLVGMTMDKCAGAGAQHLMHLTRDQQRTDRAIAPSKSFRYRLQVGHYSFPLPSMGGTGAPHTAHDFI